MHNEAVCIGDADDRRECHKVFDARVDLCVPRERREGHRCALRMAYVEDFAVSRRAFDVLQHRGQVELRVLVERELPIRAVRVGIERLVRATVVVAAHVPHPYVEARIRQHISEALVGHVVHPTNNSDKGTHPLAKV